MRHASRIGVVLWILSAAPLAANTFIVTTTSDTGAGSLRAAIEAANANAGLDTINFSIAGAGVHTIVLKVCGHRGDSGHQPGFGLGSRVFDPGRPKPGFPGRSRVARHTATAP